jgi:hypothetical protein
MIFLATVNRLNDFSCLDIQLACEPSIRNGELH